LKLRTRFPRRSNEAQHRAGLNLLPGFLFSGVPVEVTCRRNRTVLSAGFFPPDATQPPKNET
jgi:hypothetical protein